MISEFENYMDWEKNTKVSISMLQETKLNWRKPNIQKAINNIGKKAYSNITITTSCSDSSSDKNWQAGGVSIFSAGAIQNRLITQGTDPTGMGRFAYQTFRGKSNIKIAFISAYRVCDQSIGSAGDLTSYFQQWHTLKQRGVKNPQPRKQILRDLQSLILEFIFNGYDVCLGIDANAGLDDNRQQLRFFAEDCGLIDIHESIFDDDFYMENKVPATFNRGNKKIDFILCTPRLLDCVKTAAILAENVGLISDHRCLVVDFDTRRMFGEDLMTITKGIDRILKSHDVKGNSAYRQILFDLLNKRNVFTRAGKLLKNLQNNNPTLSPESCDDKAEDLDSYITRCMIKAERRAIWKRRANFSPTKIKAGKVVHFWKMALSSIKKGKEIPTAAMIYIMENHLQQDMEIPDETESIKEELKKAVSSYKDIEKRSKEIRLEFLEERAEFESMQGNITKAAAITKILNGEAAKKYFANLRRIMKRSRHQGGLTMIKIPNPNPELGNDQEYIEITDPNEIEKYLLERNRNHYAQASGTPFTGELGTLIGTSGTSWYADTILDGSVELENLSTPIQAIFKRLKSQHLDPVSTSINNEDLEIAFNRWREQTATSPSGRHLGHYKSLLVKLEDGTDEMARTIFNLHRMMINIAQMRRKPFQRWKKEVEIMLEKDVGDPKINRLRIICLYEADYNIFLKIMWAHRLMNHIEYNQLLGEAQGGGRPGRTSHDVALRKMLTYTYARATRTNFGFMDLDATACFDRIVAGFAMLCSRKYGMPSDACELHGLTIAKMQHHVKTAMKISQSFFESTPEKMIFGSGQGSSGSPPLWIVCSDVLFKALEDLVGKGMNFRNPSGSVESSRSTDAFVDDATNGVNEDRTTMLDEKGLCTKLQIQAEAWESLLYSSGGKLELPKCLVYLMIFEFPKGEPVLKQKDSILSRIKVKCSQTNVTSTIKLLDCSESHKTLGTHQNPMGEPEGQLLAMKKNEGKMCASFQTMNNLPKYQVQIAYKSFYCASVQYPLNVTMMTERESLSISKRSTRAIIGAFGVNRQFPRSIAFAPTSFMGLGLKQHEMEQWTRHSIQILQHMNQNDENGKLYTMILEYFQLISGITLPLLECPSYKIPHIQDRFIMGLRNFLSKCNVFIKTNIQIPARQRVDDRCIMEDIMEIEKSPSKIRLFNQVRLFLQVFYLSDITDPSGKKIEKCYLRHTDRSTWPSFSVISWPKQGYPTTKAWQTWSYLLRKKYLVQKLGRLNNFTLETKLGHFFSRSSRHRWWKWEFDSDSNDIVKTWPIHSGTLSISYKTKIHRQKLTINTTEVSEINAKPEMTLPLIIREEKSETILFKRINDINPIKRDEQSPNRYSLNADRTKVSYYDLERWERPLFKMMEIKQTQIPNCPSKFQIGVFSETWGSHTIFGWAISFEQGNVASGAAFVPQSNEHPNPIQGNLYAVHVATYTLHSMLQSWPSTPKTITIHVDNKDVFNIGKKMWKIESHNPRWRTNRYYEILLYIQSTICPSTIDFKLSSESEGSENFIIDKARIASEELKSPHCTNKPSRKKPSKLMKAILFSGSKVNATQITTDHQLTLHEKYTHGPFQDYHLKKYNWGKKVFQSINWRAFHHVAKKIKISSRIKIMKFIYGWLPIGKMRTTIDPDSSDKCPSCGRSENHNHLLQCSNEKHQKRREELINTLGEVCTANHMTQEEAENFTNCIHLWLTTGAQIIQSTVIQNNALQEAIQEQNKIGWQHVFRGRISNKFQQMVNERRDSALSTYESNKWTIAIIHTLWNFVSDSWDIRNKYLHGETEQEKLNITRERLIQEARKLYDFKDQIPEKDRIIFPPWEKLIKKQNDNIKMWTMTVKQTINILLDTTKQADDDPYIQTTNV